MAQQEEQKLLTSIEMASVATLGRRQNLLNMVRQLAALGMINDFSMDPFLPAMMVEELMEAALIYKRKIIKQKEAQHEPTIGADAETISNS